MRTIPGYSRPLALLALAVLLPACGDSDGGGEQDAPSGSAAYTDPAAASGISGLNEFAVAEDVGPDGEPRMVFWRDFNFYFVRRLASGSWTLPLQVNGPAASLTPDALVFVTANGFSHFVWMEAAALHYSRINDAAVPAIDAGEIDTILSSIRPSNVGAGATLGFVASISAAFDRARDTVYLLWSQSITEAGAGAADLVPVAAVLSGATGSVGERFALVDPNLDAAPAVLSGPTLAVSASGTAHAAWFGTTAAGTVDAPRHSARTGPGAWSGGADGLLVSAASPGYGGVVNFLLLAPDGDAYVSWTEPGTLSGTRVRAARRPVGAASTFDPAVTLIDDSTATSFHSVLESGTGIFHLVAQESTLTTNELFSLHWTAPQLGAAGAPSATESVAPLTLAGIGESKRVVAWADSADRLLVSYQIPPTDGDTSHTYLAWRPSGGVFAPAIDLTATYALPCSGIAVSVNASGQALISWTQGASTQAEIFAAVYSSGSVTPAANISRSPALASSGPALLRLSDGSEAHLYWREQTFGITGDVYYAGTP